MLMTMTMMPHQAEQIRDECAYDIVAAARRRSRRCTALARPSTERETCPAHAAAIQSERRDSIKQSAKRKLSRNRNQSLTCGARRHRTDKVRLRDQRRAKRLHEQPVVLQRIDDRRHGRKRSLGNSRRRCRCASRRERIACAVAVRLLHESRQKMRYGACVAVRVRDRHVARHRWQREPHDKRARLAMRQMIVGVLHRQERVEPLLVDERHCVAQRVLVERRSKRAAECIERRLLHNAYLRKKQTPPVNGLLRARSKLCERTGIERIEEISNLCLLFYNDVVRDEETSGAPELAPRHHQRVDANQRRPATFRFARPIEARRPTQRTKF